MLLRIVIIFFGIFLSGLALADADSPPASSMGQLKGVQTKENPALPALNAVQIQLFDETAFKDTAQAEPSQSPSEASPQPSTTPKDGKASD